MDGLPELTLSCISSIGLFSLCFPDVAGVFSSGLLCAVQISSIFGFVSRLTFSEVFAVVLIPRIVSRCVRGSDSNKVLTSSRVLHRFLRVMVLVRHE